jgi:hypothetical protein
LLGQAQYEILLQERHYVADWDRILTTVKVVYFDDEAEFEEVKARSAKKSEPGLAFTPSKKMKITREEVGLDSDLVFEINRSGDPPE